MAIEIDTVLQRDSGLFVADTTSTLNSNRQVAVLGSGIVLVRTPGQFILPDQVVIPRGSRRLAPGEIIVPDGVAVSTGIIRPSDEQLQRVIQENPGIEPSRHSMSELALALMRPKLFIQREIEKQYNGNVPEDILQVLKKLKENRGRYKRAHLRRKTTAVKYWDISTQSQAEAAQSSPGPLEEVGLRLAGLLEEPEFRLNAIPVILRPLSTLFRRYRYGSGKRILEVPEMPDLTLTLINSLDYFTSNPTQRFNVYELLGQISIPDSLKEELARKMDYNRDLDHPLAFEVTHRLAKSNPESKWVKAQEERRREMLDKLAVSPQVVFDSFAELMRLSRGLVFSGDLVNPASGKVGLEIETRLRKTPDYSKYRVGYKYLSLEKVFNPDWDVHPDRMNDEITKADDKLEYGTEYAASLGELSKWLKDNAKKLLSLHLHFDRRRHPNKPQLGNLFESNQGGFWQGTTIRDNSLGTWELRFLNLPKAIGSFHPARVADAINLYLKATDLDNVVAIKDARKLTTDASGDYSLPQLIFGHLVTFMPDPGGRLAALMALHDETMLKTINPLALANSFEASEGLQKVAESLGGVFESWEDLNMLETLVRYSKGELHSWYPGRGSLESRVIENSSREGCGCPDCTRSRRAGREAEERGTFSGQRPEITARNNFGRILEPNSMDYPRAAEARWIPEESLSPLERGSRRFLNELLLLRAADPTRREAMPVSDGEIRQIWSIYEQFRESGIMEGRLAAAASNIPNRAESTRNESQINNSIILEQSDSITNLGIRSSPQNQSILERTGSNIIRLLA